MIILIGSRKGGCGKSTLAINICAELTRQGKDILLIDADRQGTSSNWAADREDNKLLPKVNCTQSFGNIRGTLLDFDERYEFVIVDAAGRDSRELRTGATAADVLLIPFRPSQPDLDTLPSLKSIADAAKDFNESLSCRAVFTMVPTHPGGREINDSREYLANFPQIVPVKTTIKDRVVYRNAMAEGMGVVEMNDAKAKGEIQLLVGELING